MLDEIDYYNIDNDDEYEQEEQYFSDEEDTDLYDDIDDDEF